MTTQPSGLLVAFDELVAGTRASDLIELWLRTVEETAARARTYASLRDNASADDRGVVDEGLALAARARELLPAFPESPRARRAVGEVLRAHQLLLAVG